MLTPSRAASWGVCPAHTLPTTTLHSTHGGYNDIPEMTDPLGHHWSQPDNIRMAPMDDTHVLLTKRQIAELSHYDRGYPSGCYDGKCWLREGRDCCWLCWYHPHPVEGKIGIGSRIVVDLEDA